MTRVRDVMDGDPVVVEPQTSVRELAELLLARHADGAVVVQDGAVVGVITLMDLVFREKNVKVPTLLALLESLVPSDAPAGLEAEVEKIRGQTVAEVMTERVQSLEPDQGAREAATLMAERGFTVVPVLDGFELVGVVTRQSLVRGMLLRR